jgi:error-prone DNA polymerase
MTEYVELHARSAFSFLRGASLPEQLADRAAELGMSALGLCDRDGVYGAPRLFARAKEKGLRAIVGAELTMEDKTVLPVLVETRTGYQNLCRLLTRSHLRDEKGKAAARWAELPEFAQGLVALTGGEEGPLVQSIISRQNPRDVLLRLRDIFGSDNLFVEMQRRRLRGEERVLRAQKELAAQFRLPLLATNGVVYATESERALLDVFTCIRHHTYLDAAGTLLSRNGEGYLKNAAQMRELFHDSPVALENTARLADRLRFTLQNLGYEFPEFVTPPGHSMDSFLREQSFAGARRRYDGQVPEKVRSQLQKELALIQKLKVSGYFLIVWDMVEFCRQQNIMAQGRGSAANSTVCFCLGITAVDPLRFNTLFERFLSEGRAGSWPDIDLDLPSGERRERVIQEIYRRYAPRGAAMTANVITYRGRSAAREVGKALHLSQDILQRFSRLFANGDFPHTMELQQQVEKAGLPLDHPRAGAFAKLCLAIRGLPRHLGQHSGGMIISRGKLDSVVPLENASMPNRVVAQWDKDDCEDLGIIKVDFLGLGMMSVLQDAVELARRRGRPLELTQLPPDDPEVFASMQMADTIGLFQIESRAQMATLPRMKPKTFYDIVIEVAIIRPGPIQGNLMNPYLARRAGREPVVYYHKDLEPVLERTLGVPLFQEQMLQMAMVLADFSGAEAEELRRALSFHRSDERMERVKTKLRAALERKGHSAKVIDEITKTVSSFALYGFPESHAISFAHLAYASACYKTHRAPEFFTSLLNNQPMGFYSASTLIKDGQRHGLKFLPVCVAHSELDCAINPDDSLRLGLRAVNSLRGGHAQQILAERNRSPFTSLADFKQRVHLNKEELRTLAKIGALNCFVRHRRDALWEAESTICQDDLFVRPEAKQSSPSPLPEMSYAERIQADFSGMNLSTGKHPMALLRSRLPQVCPAGELAKAAKNGKVCIAGNVICRQRPGTAKGFVFISLEDETGISNAIVAPSLFETHRLLLTEERFLLIEGRLQNAEGVVHVKAERIERLNADSFAGSRSYDFH